MKSRLLVNIVLLLALAGLALYAYFRPTEDSKPDVRISQLSRDEIERVRIERRDAPATEVEKRNGIWHMLRPYQTRVEQLQIDRLLDIAAATASEKLAAENLARFGLDPASVRVTLNDQAFAFGSINEITNEQYLGSGDSVYLIRTYFGYGIPLNATKLVSHRLLANDETPVAFDFGSWQVVTNEKAGWSIQGRDMPGGEPLSADTLNQWVAEWQLASSLSVAQHAGSARGLGRVVIQFGNGSAATFRILSREPQVQLLRVGENMRYEFGSDAGARLLEPWRVAGE